MPPMLYVLIFLTAFLAFEGVAMLVNDRLSGHRAAARRRLRQIALGIQNPEVQSEASILRARLRAGRRLPDLTRLVPGGYQLERRLYQAGLAVPVSRFLTVCAAIGVTCWLLGAIVLIDPVTPLPLLLVGLLPFWYIGTLRDRRTVQFEEQFPEALDMMTRAMRAGHSLTSGFQMVGEELPDPVGAEFTQMAEEIKLGQELRVALNNLAYRMQATDLPFFVTAITIQRKTGGNLAEVLEKLSALIRERLKLYGKVRALTSVGRATANLLVCMPFAMVALLYTCGGAGGRAYVQPLYSTVSGYILSGTALGLIVVGYVLCRRMARIEV